MILVGLCLVLMAGCGSGADRESTAAATATAFARAVADRDGRAACDLLAPPAAEAVTASGDAGCAEAILSEPLPAPSPVSSSRVYGQRALVQLGEDAVFLGMFPGGWRVVAAGCTPPERDGRPYRCAVSS